MICKSTEFDIKFFVKPLDFPCAVAGSQLMYLGFIKPIYNWFDSSLSFKANVVFFLFFVW